MKIEELDIATWVASAEPNKKTFREAVHIILAAISSLRRTRNCVSDSSSFKQWLELN
jgi:hypothetical protein